jgi:D-cysteine desulfhydrase
MPGAAVDAPPATPTSELAVVRRFPEVGRALPRFALTVLPTPVEPLTALGRHNDIGSLWIKRDDVSSPLYGGNKPRKLEWLIGRAQRAGRRLLLTFGGIGTNHGLATAICGAAAGMRTQLVLIPQPVTAHVRHNLLLDHAYGAELHLAGSVSGVVMKSLSVLVRDALRGDFPAVIPTGGTSALGAVGFVNAALELAEQVRAGQLPEPDFLFVPLGSGGTVAGLAVGLRLAALRTRVVGVLVTDILPPSAARLVRLGHRCLRLLRACGAQLPSAALAVGDIEIVSGFVGRGYGAVTEAGLEAQRMAEDLEGIHLETTYSGKCLAALLALAQRPPYRGRELLFWNTYSAIDPAQRLAQLADFHQLPAPFQRFFCDG